MTSNEVEEIKNRNKAIKTIILIIGVSIIIVAAYAYFQQKFQDRVNAEIQDIQKHAVYDQETRTLTAFKYVDRCNIIYTINNGDGQVTGPQYRYACATNKDQQLTTQVKMIPADETPYVVFEQCLVPEGTYKIKGNITCSNADGQKVTSPIGDPTTFSRNSDAPNGHEISPTTGRITFYVTPDMAKDAIDVRTGR